MSLVRRSIRVRTKKGRVYQRSAMVKSVPGQVKRYMAPGRFISKHKNQFAAMFAHGFAQGAAAHTAAKLAHARHGKLAGAAAGIAAYGASDHAGRAIWKRAMGEHYDNISQDFARLAPHTEAAMTRVFHGVGYAGNVAGAIGSWATHRLVSKRRAR